MTAGPPGHVAVDGPGAGDRAILTLRVGEASAEQVSATVAAVASDGRVAVDVGPAFVDRVGATRPGTLVALDCPRADGLWRVSAIVEEVGGTVVKLGRPHDPRPADRRRYLRAHVRIPVRLGEDDAAVAYSIGAGGLAATVTSPIDLDSLVEVVLDAREVRIDAAARVVWCEAVRLPGRSRVGAEFVRLDDTAQDALLSLVAAARRRVR